MRIENGVMARRFCRRDEAGTSLAELLFAMAAGLVVFVATLQALSSFQQRFVGQQRDVGQQQDLRLGLELLEQELRLAGVGSVTIAATDVVEFSANLHGLVTAVTTPVAIGQTTLAVDDGRGWDQRKTIAVCWIESCETLVLSRDGQRRLLTVTQPLTRAIPAGASVSLLNRVRYYSRRDEQAVLRLLRQVDGGANVLVGNIQDARFTYWDDQGRTTTSPALIRRVVVDVAMPQQATRSVREISLRS
jgi:hypothetical protein